MLDCSNQKRWYIMKKILIIEDDINIHNLIKELLIQKQEMKYEKENKNVKKLILKLF